jgi:hypothetical protein
MCQQAISGPHVEQLEAPSVQLHEGQWLKSTNTIKQYLAKARHNNDNRFAYITTFVQQPTLRISNMAEIAITCWTVYNNKNAKYSCMTYDVHQSYLIHQRSKIKFMRLSNNPMSISAQSPASNWTNKSFLVRQTRNQIWYQLGKMNNHTWHATCWVKLIQ